MLTVLTWLWAQPGGRLKYTGDHVNIWAAMVRRHLTIPHRIACVTRERDGIDKSIDIIEPPGDFENVRIPTWNETLPQCLRRIAMFRPDAADIFGKRFVNMDLDVVISGNIDSLLDRPQDIVLYRGGTKKRPYNGSMTMMTAGCRPQVYTRFTPEGAAEAGRLYKGSDQAWVCHVLGWGEATWDLTHGVHWWSPINPRPRMLFFPGPIKPWDLVDDDPWMDQHYRGEKTGKCLILGYAPNVWDDLARVKHAAPFDAVIACPEVREHWRELGELGPLAAIAQTDMQAERIARTLGFKPEMVTFCGKTQIQEQEAA